MKLGLGKKRVEERTKTWGGQLKSRSSFDKFINQLAVTNLTFDLRPWILIRRTERGREIEGRKKVFSELLEIRWIEAEEHLNNKLQIK